MPKSMLRWNGIAILFVLGLTMLLAPMLLPSHAYACSCAVSPSVASEFAKKTAIFTGEVTDIKIHNNSMKVQSSIDPVDVTFKVQQVWKGEKISEKTVVKTVRSDESCGYPFKEAQAYLVYAYGDGSNLEVGLCSGTKLLAEAGIDLKELNVLQKPVVPIASPTNMKVDHVTADEGANEPARYFEPSGLWVIAVVIAVVIVVLSGAFAVWHYRRRRF
ncbi:hypothetical protein [Paenibacillus sp. MMS18-CY102]|uniref:hypothetical protein n=1 Tax=Paenibacillus sp. MMS18-CY102 TaxID=2682849 RepID=UPI0013652BB4|nr:hypothetical protein [Paenibacillus sp. MMS18-CY102]MWC27920.1 hypothetical protein [Paenibacillus sp. MMS18-CY102]